VKAFESSVVKRISGLKVDTIRGSWSKLHCDEFHSLYLIIASFYKGDQRPE